MTVPAIWIILHLMQQQIILQCTKRIESSFSLPVMKVLLLLVPVFGSEEELPPGMPSTMVRFSFNPRASSSAGVYCGGAGPPPVLFFSAFFLVAVINRQTHHLTVGFKKKGKKVAF